MTHQSTPDGMTYVAYEDKLSGLNRTIWKVISKEGNINIKSTVEGKNASEEFGGIATQVSDDGKHLLLAYLGPYNESSVIKHRVYFTESVDGGIKWSIPIQVSDSGIYIPPNYSISLVLERDTRSVYLFHAMKRDEKSFNSQIVVYLRERNERTFKKMNTSVDLWRLGPFSAFVTRNINDGTKYVHLITTFYDDMHHFRSSDKGKSWDRHKVVGDIIPYNYNYVAYDLEARPASFYTIYRKDNKAYIIWTHDNGKTFSHPMQVGDSPRPNHETIGFCGSNKTNESVVVVAHTDSDPGKIFVKIMTNHNNQFIDLVNPFIAIRESPIANLMVDCVSRGPSEYYITFYMLTTIGRERMYVAFGILNFP